MSKPKNGRAVKVEQLQNVPSWHHPKSHFYAPFRDVRPVPTSSNWNLPGNFWMLLLGCCCSERRGREGIGMALVTLGIKIKLAFGQPWIELFQEWLLFQWHFWNQSDSNLTDDAFGVDHEKRLHMSTQTSLVSKISFSGKNDHQRQSWLYIFYQNQTTFQLSNSSYHIVGFMPTVFFWDWWIKPKGRAPVQVARASSKAP